MTELRGLLADAHADRLIAQLRGWIEAASLWEILGDAGIQFVTFADLGIPENVRDRPLWERCQADGWVLLTDNRNADGPDSLHATLVGAWSPGDLPVVTVGDKERAGRDPTYAAKAAVDIADILYGLAIDDGQFDQAPRLFVPRPS